MKLFLASADRRAIRVAVERGLIDGVVTSPAMLAARAGSDDPKALVAELCRAAQRPVYVTVPAVRDDDVLRDARDLAKISDLVVVQVPFVEDTISAIHQLSQEGVRVAATLVFTAAQALLAAKAGAYAVCTDIDLLEAFGTRTEDALRDLRMVLDRHRAECDVVALQPRTAAQFAACASSGADAVALDESLLHELLVHPLTDRGLDRLLSELSRRPRGLP
jgi:transaldolase